MMEFKDNDGNVTQTISDEGLLSRVGTEAPSTKLEVTKAALIGTYEAHVVNCPKHGEHPHSILSTIAGHEGAWCQICWPETLGQPLPVERKRLPFKESES